MSGPGIYHCLVLQPGLIVLAETATGEDPDDRDQGAPGCQRAGGSYPVFQDATLNTARFASKSMASSVAMRHLLWLRQWQTDVFHKWCLASAPFKVASLFGESLDPILVETRDKRNFLPSATRRGLFCPSPPEKF